MATATIRFAGRAEVKITQGENEYAYNAELPIEVRIDDGPFVPTTVPVKLTVGEAAKAGHLEVGHPKGIKGNWDHAAFTAAVRRNVLQPREVKLPPGTPARTLIFYDFRSKAKEETFEVATGPAGW